MASELPALARVCPQIRAGSLCSAAAYESELARTQTLPTVDVLNNVSRGVTRASAAFSEPDLNVYTQLSTAMIHTLYHTHTHAHTCKQICAQIISVLAFYAACSAVRDQGLCFSLYL